MFIMNCAYTTTLSNYNLCIARPIPYTRTVYSISSQTESNLCKSLNTRDTVISASCSKSQSMSTSKLLIKNSHALSFEATSSHIKLSQKNGKLVARYNVYKNSVRHPHPSPKQNNIRRRDFKRDISSTLIHGAPQHPASHNAPDATIQMVNTKSLQPSQSPPLIATAAGGWAKWI